MMGVFQHWLGLSEEQLLTVFKLILDGPLGSKYPEPDRLDI